MSADRIPNYMFVNQQTQELFDKRIKQRTQYDTSTSVPVKVIKKSINNTINFQDQLIDQSNLNQICYSSKFGLLIVLTKQGLLIIDLNQYEELLLKSSENSNKKYNLKDLTSRILKVQGENSKIFLTFNQSRLFILSEQRLVLYDLDTLNVQFNSHNQNKITNIVFTQENGHNFMGWSFCSNIYAYQKKDKQVIFRQAEDIQHCTCANFINQHVIICQKIQDNGDTRLIVLDKKCQNLIKQHTFTSIGSQDNYLLQFCYPISIFKIDVNIQDPVTKNITAKTNKLFTQNDIYGIVLAYYDENQEEPDHRYLNFIKGNLIEQSDDIQIRGQQLFLSPSDERQCYFDQDQNKIPFDVEVVQLGHFLAISMTKLESVFVVDSLLPFEDLNIFALNANHEIRESSHQYLKGVCAMKNMLQFERKPPKFAGDNKTCEMICGKFRGEFMSLYFPAKQTQITIQFPASIIVLAKNKLIRKYAISTVNGIEEDNIAKIEQQIAKKGGKSSQLVIPQRHKFQINKNKESKSNEVSSNQIKKPQSIKQENQPPKVQIKKQEKITDFKQAKIQEGVSLNKKPANSLFDNNSSKSNLFANSGTSNLFNSNKLFQKKETKSSQNQNLNKIQKNTQQFNTTQNKSLFGSISPFDIKLGSNLFQKKSADSVGSGSTTNLFEKTNTNIFGKTQEGSSLGKGSQSLNKPNIFDSKDDKTNPLLNNTSNLFGTNKLFSKPENIEQKQKSSQDGSSLNKAAQTINKPNIFGNNTANPLLNNTSNLFGTNKLFSKPQNVQQKSKPAQSTKTNPFQNISNQKKLPSQSQNKSSLFGSQTQTQNKNIFGNSTFSSNNVFNLQKDMNMMTNIPEFSEQDESFSKISKQQSSIFAKKQDNKNKVITKEEQKKQTVLKQQQKKLSSPSTLNKNKEVSPPSKKQTKTEEKSIKTEEKSLTIKKQQSQKVVKNIQQKPLQKKEQNLQSLATGVPMTSKQLSQLFFGRNRLNSIDSFSRQQRNSIFKQMAKMMKIPIKENQLEFQMIQEVQEPLNQQQRYERIKKQFQRKKHYTKIVEYIQKSLDYIKTLKSLQISNESFFTIRNAQKCQYLFMQNPQMESFLQGNSIRNYLQRAIQLSKIYKDSINFNSQRKTGHKFGFDLNQMQNQSQLIEIKLTTFQNQIKKLVYSYNLVFPGKNQSLTLTNLNNRKNKNNINQIDIQKQARSICQQKIESHLISKTDQLQYLQNASVEINSQLDYKIQQQKYLNQRKQEQKDRKSKIKSKNTNNQKSTVKGACFKFSMDDVSISNSSQEQKKSRQQIQDQEQDKNKDKRAHYKKSTIHQQKKSKIISNLVNAVNKKGEIRIDLKPRTIFLSQINTTDLVQLIDQDDENIYNNHMTENIMGNKQNLMRSSLKKKVDFLDKVPKKQELISNKNIKNHEVQSQNFQDSRRQENDNSFSNSENSQQQDIVVPQETNRQISFSPILFAGKKQPKKQIKTHGPLPFGSQLNIKKTIQKEVIVQKNSSKNEDKMKPNLKTQNEKKISQMFTKMTIKQSKQKIPESHKPLSQMFSSGTFGLNKPSLFGNQSKGQKNQTNSLFGSISGVTLQKKQQKKQKPKQQNALFKDSKLFSGTTPSLFGNQGEKQKKSQKQTNIQSGKTQMSKPQKSELFSHPSKGNLFGPKNEEKGSTQPKGLFQNKQPQKMGNLFGGGNVNKGTLFSNQNKQKQGDNVKKQNQQKKPSIFANAGKSKQPQEKKQKVTSLAFGSPQFSQHFNKQKQQQKKQENKTGLFNNINNKSNDGNKVADTVIEQKKQNQNSQNSQVSSSFADDAKMQQKIEKTQINNKISNDPPAKSLFETSNQKVSNPLFNNQNTQNLASNTQSTSWGVSQSWGVQNQTFNKPNHGITTFGAQNKFMTSNAPLNNQQSGGFNPNAVSLSGGFTTSNNLKSFASFNNTNPNNNNNQPNTNLFNQQQPTTNNQPVQMSNSQPSLFGQSSGMFGNNNQFNNNMSMSQSGFFQSNPQQQSGGNFLSNFNPSNQGNKAPVAPTGNTHLFQPRK